MPKLHFTRDEDRTSDRAAVVREMLETNDWRKG
jgi:hypothetical protein